jgi:predicted Fe-Mo cluster-binding NifX family protein
MGKAGLEEAVGEHFGRVPYYTIFDTETEKVEVEDNTSEHMGGRGLPPDVISQWNVDIMLCGGLGRRAIMLFEQYGIMVYVGARGKVSDAIQMWKDGQLQPATDENACRQHAHHGERFSKGGCDGDHEH